MLSLRDAPGYAEMEDYYDSDYVPLDLIENYNALLQEKRRRAEHQFTVAAQAHGLAATHDGLAVTTDSAASLQLRTQSTPSATLLVAAQQQQQNEGQPPRSSVRSPLRQGTSTTVAIPTLSDSSRGHGGSVPRPAPRTSVALDAIYAAREVGHGYKGTPSSSPIPSHAAATTPVRSPPTPSHKKPKKKKKTQHLLQHPQPRVRAAEEEAEPVQRDLYDSAVEERRQERFFSESQRLGKPFVPSGGSGLDLPTRFMLGDCVKMLYRSIVPDWRDASPMVVSTAEDLIAVYFSLEKLAKPQVTALLQYMNACLLHNTAIREFHLTKVPEGWDVLTNDGYVLYTFRPPWVKKRVFLPDTVNPLHAHLRDGED